MKKIIIANWKMNPPTFKEAQEIFSRIKKELGRIKNLEVVVCPPFVYLSEFKKPGQIKLGGQDCFWEEKSGPFTGEISPAMLKNFDCSFVILGHSERRKHFGENYGQVNKKLKAALSAGLMPILCVGEETEERAAGRTEKTISNQINLALRNIDKALLENGFIIVYEPVWAISTSKIRHDCSSREINEAVRLIAGVLSQALGEKISRKIPILYGGNVNEANAKQYLNETKIQGFLVGGASLKPKSFAKLVKAAAR